MKKNMRLYKMGVFFRKFILYFILLFFALLWLIPFFFLVMGSFKSTSELFQVPFRWLPKHFDFDNYINMFQQIPFLRYLKNTLIIVFFSVVGALISNSLIAYGFSRLRWPGRDKVFNDSAVSGNNDPFVFNVHQNALGRNIPSADCSAIFWKCILYIFITAIPYGSTKRNYRVFAY